MKTAHLESAFQAEIVAHLVAHGRTEGDGTAYPQKTGLDTRELYERLADELASRGTVDVRRPAHERTPG